MSETDAEFQKRAEELEAAKAEEVLKWALETYRDKVAFASSFGAEDVVVIYMMAQIDPKSRIFTLDTGRLPQETYEVMETIRDKYGVTIETYAPDTEEVEKMVTQYGPNLFYEGIEFRKMCCNTRKIVPLKRALGGLSAWISGLRKEQSVTRTGISKVEVDKTNNSIVKINPLADWTEAQVWEYIKDSDIPYNALHDQNFPSIGCAPCTRAVKPGEDIRAGRWWWETPEQKECGLHAKKE